MHDRSSLFRMPAEGIVQATNPAPTLDPSFAVGREDRGEVSRFCRASLRAGVARLLARSVQGVANPACLSPFPYCALLRVARYCAPGGVRVVSDRAPVIRGQVVSEVRRCRVAGLPHRSADSRTESSTTLLMLPPRTLGLVAGCGTASRARTTSAIPRRWPIPPSWTTSRRPAASRIYRVEANSRAEGRQSDGLFTST